MLEGDPQSPVPTHHHAGDPLVGRVLNDRFRIVEAIGSGGMGRVYKAVQTPLDRLVALKVLNPNFPAEKDPAFKRRFFLEASLTSKLRHPNTVTVFDYGQTEDGIYFIAMEYMEGHTLAEVLSQEKTLPWHRVLDIGQQICRSLREAHKLGVIHRDLKPANVMLLNESDRDSVKVLDFGLVKSFADLNPGDPEVTQNGVFLGSPQYMAPEQARNVADPRSDVYSLGILLYQMLTGRPPFLGKDYLEVIFLHMKEPPRRLRDVRADIPAEVEALVLRCLEKDPINRFQSMDEVLEAMRTAAQLAGASGVFGMGRSGIAATPPPLPSPSGLNSRVTTAPIPGRPDLEVTADAPFAKGDAQRRRLLAIGGFTVAVLAGFALVWLLVPKGGEQVAVREEPKPAPVVAAFAPKPPEQAAPENKMVRFHVTTEPSGAHVYVGRHDLGATPTSFELPAGPDGLANAEVVLILDGYPNQSISQGGSGDVLVNVKLQRKVVARIPTPTAPKRNEEEREAGPVPVPVRENPAPAPNATAAVARAAETSPRTQVASLQPAPVAVAPVSLGPTGPVEFTAGMTPPELISGPSIEYTQKALDNEVEGEMLVKCLVSVQGTVQKCRVLKAIRFMDRAVVDALEHRRYRPAALDGKAVDVDYTFRLKLKLPR